MKRRTWVSACLLGFAALISGCALNNVSSDYAPDAKGDKGVLVVSLGRSGAIDFDMNAVVKSIGSGPTYTIIVDNSTTPKDFGKVVIPPRPSQASDWGYAPASAPLERIVVVAMRAGDYEIASINGKAPRFKGADGSPFAISSDRLGLRFSIRPGEVTYLGSVVFGFPDWLATSHPSGPLHVIATDTRERDLTLLKERYPQLASRISERNVGEGPYSSPNLKYYLFIGSEGGDSRGI